MAKKLKCVMCREEADFIATETNVPLCDRCNSINEFIKHTNYPEKAEKFKCKPIYKEEDFKNDI